MKFSQVARNRATPILPILALFLMLQAPDALAAVAADQPTGVVEAVQGQAYIVGSAEAGRQPLSRGEAVPAWKTVTTDDNSKLLLQWRRNILTSLGALSTLFVTSKATDTGEVADIQLIEGVLRVSTGSGGVSGPYSLTTPVAAIQPEPFDGDVDFIAEVYTNPSVTIVTVLRGRVRVKNLSTQRAGEQVVEPCRNVYVEDGKPISDVGAVSGEVVGTLVAQTTIEGTAMAEVDVCGLREMARPQPPPAAPPSGYVYLDDSDYIDLYPYDEIEILPPEYARGPIVCILPGIGRWYFPYEIYHAWGFGPDVIRVYVMQVLLQRSLYYDNYYWNSFNARRHEYYDVLYAAQLAGNRRLIAQTQQQLDYLRIRQNLLGRGIHRLQQRVRSLDGRLPRNAQNQAILGTIYNSLDSAKNIRIANRFRDRIQNQVQIQNRLAGNTAQELVDLRARVAEARDPRQRLKLRRNLEQFRDTIREGRLPIQEKNADVKSILAKVAKTENPDQLENLQKQLGQKLGRQEVTQQAPLVNQSQLNELKQRVERANPAARRHVDRILQNLQQARRQRQEIETAQEKMNKAMSEAAATKDESRREQLLRQAVEFTKKPSQGTLRGPLQALQEQQRLQSQLLGREKGKEREQALQRLRELTNKQAQTIPRPPGMVPPELGKKPEQVPSQVEMRKRTQEEASRKMQEEAARKRQEELKQQAEQGRRRAQELLKQQQEGASQAEKQRLQQQQAERLKKQQEQAGGQAEIERQRRHELEQKQKEAVKKQREEQLQKSRMQELSTQQERAKARQQEQKLQQQRLQEQRLQQQRLQEQKLQQQRLQEQRSQQQRLQQQRSQEQQRIQQQQRLQQQKAQGQQRIQQQRQQQQRLQQQQRVQQQQLQLQRQRKLPQHPTIEQKPGGPPLR